MSLKIQIIVAIVLILALVSIINMVRKEHWTSVLPYPGLP